MYKILALAALGIATFAQAEADLACFESSANKRTYCIDRHEARVSANTRAAVLYALDEAKAAQPAGLSLIANCETKKTGLLNADGKDITDGRSPSPVAEALAKNLCEVAKPKNDPTLPLF
ncbi:hypothetical protein [Chitinolyticbacter meiyuanensis]|uniref:hypothetical protein n=1 Tax=Chitinolyticbacter meiyuanensis TaxID=682798 RepID=UPI0011E5CAD5|nr:hypothetical protein [Chitinolyticbacter meiyuanensis]